VKDASDFVVAGGTRGDLEAAAAVTPVWVPLEAQGEQMPAPSVSGGGISTHPQLALSDSGNAERLVMQHGRDVRFCPETGKWLAWDGSRFRVDALPQVHLMAKGTIRDMYTVASGMPDADRQRLVTHALKSEGRDRRNAMVDLARWENGIPVSTDKLDSDNWLLNVENGTLDLRTGSLRDHRREDLITKAVPVAFDPQAICPTWERFLTRAMGGDPELIAFLRRAVGYSLTGDVSEQVLFFLFGSGANGKSTFCLILLALVGEYAKQAAPTLLQAKHGESHPTEQADLLGARLVVAQEVEQGRSMAEVAVKQITGGDRIKARLMRQDFFEFRPSHKLWLAANHKPVIRGTDYAIWRRILLVPFTVTIPKKERDRALPEKLRAELPGVLNWALQGCLEWQRNGLLPPKKVLAATAEYRAEMDIIGDFIGERCVPGAASSVGASDLYRAYKEWSEATGERVISQKALGANLGERRGLSKRKTGGRIVWEGLRLRGDDEAAAAPSNGGDDGEDDAPFPSSPPIEDPHQENPEMSLDPPHPPSSNGAPF
jgi:putative DNA primase/helicase